MLEHYSHRQADRSGRRPHEEAPVNRNKKREEEAKKGAALMDLCRPAAPVLARLGQKPAGSRLRPMIAIFLRAACARSAGMTSHFDDQPSAINGIGPSDPLNGLPRGRLRRECTAEKVSAAARLSGLEKAGAGGPLGLPLAKEKRRGGRHAPVPGVRSGCAPYLACGFDHQAQLVALRFHGDVVAVHCAAEAALR